MIKDHRIPSFSVNRRPSEDLSHLLYHHRIHNNTIPRPSIARDVVKIPKVSVKPSKSDDPGIILEHYRNPQKTKTKSSPISSVFSSIKTWWSKPVAPRESRIVSNKETTYEQQTPEEILEEFCRILKEMKVDYRSTSPYCLSFAITNVTLEMEVCKFPRLSNVYGIKFNRLEGDPLDYKEICEDLRTKLKIRFEV